MNKTGLVMRAEKNSVSIMTSSGEFFKVKIVSKAPKIGDEYTGKLKKENSFIKKLVTAACVLFMVSSGGGVYAYYTPTSSVVININPSIELSANRWNKIIRYSALNKDGEIILKDIAIKNKSLYEGLNLIVEQSKKDDFINEKYIKDDKVINIKLTSKNNKSVDLEEFKRYIFKNNLNLQINENGTETYFNKKFDKANLKGKVVDPPNVKKAENPLVKSVTSVDNKVIVNDIKKKENEIQFEKNKRGEKSKYDEKNKYDGKNNDKNENKSK